MTEHYPNERRSSTRRRLVLVATLALLAMLSSLLVPASAESKPRPPTPHSKAAKAKAAKAKTAKAKTTKAKTTKAKTAKAGKPKVKHRAAKAAALADAPATDISTGLPNLSRSGTTGDFLGRGYAQRAIVENGRLNIYDVPARGGGLLRSTATDLAVPPALPSFPFDPAHKLSAIYVRWTPDGLFMSGSQGSRAGGDYKIVLYRLPADGSCATRSCATWVKDDFDNLRPIGNPAFFVTITMSIMSMAYGTIGTGASAKPVLAVGLSTSSNGAVRSYPSLRTDQQGVWVLDAGTGAQLGTTYNEYVCCNFDFNPVPVLDLAWDPNGSGLLSIVFYSPGSGLAVGNAVPVSADGTYGARTYWLYTPSTDSASILSTAIGYLGDDTTPVVAYGLVDGSVRLWNPATITSTPLASYTASSDPVNALSFVDRVVGSAGAQDIVAVSTENDTARVLRYDGTGTLQPQFVAPGGQPADTKTDVNGIQSWYPGYKSGRLKLITVNPDEDLTVSFAARETEGYGCWFAPAFPGSTAFPNSNSITMPAGGSTTDLYTMGGLTAATSGNCAIANDSVGQWASYLVVAPASRPAERSTIKLALGRDGKPTVTVVGGSITATATSTTLTSSPGYPLGVTTLTLTDPPTAKPAKPLKPSAVQIDNTDPDSPIYRVDVPASTWTLPPVTPARISAELKPLEVYGSATAGGPQTLLGYLAPQGLPSRVATSGTITLAPVSFYWQNPAPPAPQVSYVTITMPDDVAPVSASVDLTKTAPPDDTGATVTDVEICPANGASPACDGTAAPYANGLDQSAIRIILKDTNSNTLPTTDPGYGRIFYRDGESNLITGLIPTDGSPWTRVSPYRGAYPNDGSNQPPSQPGRVGGRFGYLSTTDTDRQQITGYLGNYAGSNGGTMAVNGTPRLSLSPVASSNQLSVSQGFKLNTCPGDFSDNATCAIAQPRTTATGSAPAMYYTNDPLTGELRIGLQFQYLAQTAAGNGLPLQQLAGQPEHNVAQGLLAVSAGEVTFAESDTNFQPADDVNIWLVVHGQQITVPPINVGQAN